MKKIFVEARYNGQLHLDKIKKEKMPDKIGIVASIQFIHLIPQIKSALEKKGKDVYLSEGTYSGQVLGCDQYHATILEDKIAAFLYIGDGRFHPLGIAEKTEKPVFTFDPVSGRFSQVTKHEISVREKKRKTAYLKFLHAKNVGIIISTKPGQMHLNYVSEIAKKIKDKELYYFLCDNYHDEERANFRFIDSWINTACPRISDGKDIINYEDLRKLL